MLIQSVYQLKISLRGAKPPIWRRILVPANITLLTLHDIIQSVMGWSDTHLAEFETQDGRNFPLPAPLENDVPPETEKVLLNQVLKTEQQTLTYVYDFGDNWEHIILLEKRLKASEIPNQPLPVCLKAVGACPWEDSGGVWGYAEKLQILQNPKHPDYEDLQEWLPTDTFDPKAVDLDGINQGLQHCVLV